MQTWTNQNINQTTKFNTWCRADRWDEGRCALCLPHLPTPVIQPSGGRQREPLPFSAAPDEIKGMNRQRNWESCSTNPPTQSAATTKALWQGLEAEQYNHSLILANPARVLLIWVLCSKAPQWQKTAEQALLLFFTSLEFILLNRRDSRLLLLQSGLVTPRSMLDECTWVIKGTVVQSKSFVNCSFWRWS